MFTRLLVPLDGSPEAMAALPAAATLARATGAAITLVRVVGHQREHASDDQQAADQVRLSADKLAADGLHVDWLVRPAPVAASIIQAAVSSKSEVIVMATHARSGLARVFAGSVSEAVLADSDRLVLLVAPDGKQLDRIRTLLVPVDGTAGGALALGATVGLARATGARLVLLEIVVPTPLWMYGGVGYVPTSYIDPAWDEDGLRSAQTYVEGVRARLAQTGLQVESRALAGQVAPTIQAVAEQTSADMIVMSTHSLTGPARAVLGSVADAVVRTSQRPVLLVRRVSGSLDATQDSLQPATAVGP